MFWPKMLKLYLQNQFLVIKNNFLGNGGWKFVIEEAWFKWGGRGTGNRELIVCGLTGVFFNHLDAGATQASYCAKFKGCIGWECAWARKLLRPSQNSHFIWTPKIIRTAIYFIFLQGKSENKIIFTCKLFENEIIFLEGWFCFYFFIWNNYMGSQ